MKTIYEPNFWYDSLLWLATRYFRNSYRTYRVDGLEKIPKDGAVIFAPNHCDALMDPFAVLTMNSGKKIFAARADIFRKPGLEKVLTFLRILPIHRVRDGFRNVANSEKTIEKAIEILNNRVPFCILPEGAHRPMHSLLPLGKGISRIAYRADKERSGDEHVYIVPVGCEYGDYFRFRSTLLLTVGQPFDVSEHIAAHPEKNEPEMYSEIRDITAEKMKENIVFIPDDDDYAATWELSKLMTGTIPERKVRERMRANRDAVRRIGELRKKAPEKARALFDKAVAFAQQRREAKVSIHATHTHQPLGAALWHTLKAIAGLPFALVYALVSSPVWIVGERLAGKAKDPTFRNSFRFVAIVIIWTLLLLIGAIVLLCTVKWYWALAALVLLLPAPMLLYDWVEQGRRMASAWRYCCNRKLRQFKLELLNELNSVL